MPENIHYVETSQALAEAVDRIDAHDVIGVDTESDSMYCYAEKVCFIQVIAGEDIYLIDTIRLCDIAPLAGIFADPARLAILHGADYDVVCLHRDFGARFGQIFDTMIAAQFLGREALGLAALCSELFGAEMDKSLTRHNWAIRPVEEKYIGYLCQDVRYLVALRDALAREVERAGIIEEVDLEFERVRGLVWQRREFDPEGYRKIKGCRDLDRRGAARLKALFAVREKISEREDLPPFKVLNNQAMLAMARRRGSRQGDLKGFRPKMLKKYGDEIRSAVAAADRGKVKLLRPPSPPRPSPEAISCQEALRKWRRKQADSRGCPTMVVLPNPVLGEVVGTMPRSKEELSAIPGIGKSRVERYGEGILKVVRQHRRSGFKP